MIHNDSTFRLIGRLVTSGKAEGLRACSEILAHYCEKSGISSQQVADLFSICKDKADEILTTYCSDACHNEVVEALKSIFGQKDVLTLINYMYGMSNITAGIYSSWSADFTKDYLFEKIGVLKTEFAKETIDYTKILHDDLGMLGFRPWDDKMDMLIPMWLFRLLPDDTKLYCPLTEDNEIVLRKDADDDSRFGCSAYALRF